MEDFIDYLTGATTGITSTVMWEYVGALVPLIIIIFGFVFGLNMIIKIIRDCRP